MESKFESVAISAVGYKTYIFYYRFNGIDWSFKINAADAQEALERVHSLALYGRLMGEEVYSLTMPRGLGWLAKAIVRIRSWIYR